MTQSSQTLRPSVVLVADRTLSGNYRVLFEGIFGTMQTTSTPRFMMRHLLSPPMPTDAAGRAKAAPLGLRRVESALRAHGLTEADVAVATPETLSRLMGPWTKVVAVSSSDPLGQAMSNTTTHWFCGGELYTAKFTAEMMHRINTAKQQYGFTVIAGGAGAWQWAADPAATQRQGIDTVFEGYFESAGPALIESILAGGAPPAHVSEQGTCLDAIAPIRGASLMGALELSRGCGNGCTFCTSSAKAMVHLPQDLILADLEANAAAGLRAVVSGSEDFFRYGARGWKLNPAALCQLLEAMRKAADLSFMQIDHANVASIVQLEKSELKEIRRLLTWGRPCEYLWVNVGVESASGRLIGANGAGKLGPFAAGDWADLVRLAAARLRESGFFPVFSIVLGLPGETPDDIAATHRLVRELSTGPCVIFPVFYVPAMSGDPAPEFTTADMRADHLALFSECYELNFKRVPLLFWDNQRAGGVSWLRRSVYQTLGRGEVMLWRRRFARLAGSIAAKEAKAPHA
ncbi:MAG: B12-binding domain-containing radical SAM protein [Planctomycetaceae bacterium]|nr:B12-binding domain-containing radical SAM protein [Planctomycetaceae bacterium]